MDIVLTLSTVAPRIEPSFVLSWLGGAKLFVILQFIRHRVSGSSQNLLIFRFAQKHVVFLQRVDLSSLSIHQVFAALLRTASFPRRNPRLTWRTFADTMEGFGGSTDDVIIAVVVTTVLWNVAFAHVEDLEGLEFVVASQFSSRRIRLF